MAFDFSAIQHRIQIDAQGFVEECEYEFEDRVKAAAKKIADTAGQSPIVLLSGPSGSGKTTTAKKIEQALGNMGIRTYAISMDNYFVTVDEKTHPRSDDGSIDFESPDCLDLALLGEHFKALAAGREVMVPKFEFSTQSRNPARAIPLRLRKNEVAVFEGIHAFNDQITQGLHGEAVKLYISARSNVNKDGATFFKGTWMRFMRRMTRDSKFRSCPPEQTMCMWASVRRGEKRYISPYKHKADITIDSALPYEPGLMHTTSLSLLAHVPDCERAPELYQIGPRLTEFVPIPESMVRPESLLREFIGGGTYVY